jgi:pyruvate formate lyase activating enzyme
MSLDYLGFLPVDLTNYPGRVSSVVFTRGCPLRCPYCHNPELVVGPTPQSFLSRSEVIERILQRKKLISGLVITGGEPLMHNNLEGLVLELESSELPIKLDTCGYYPDRLETILTHNNLQWVAMDVKTFPNRYNLLGPNSAGPRMIESLHILLAWKTALPNRVLQLRTTFAPGIIELDEFSRLKTELRVPNSQDILWTQVDYTPGNCLDPKWNNSENVRTSAELK